jgi:MFS family permease
MLVLGIAAQTVACVFVYGVPYLAPALRDSEQLSLAQVGALVACPTVGLVLALVAWGAAADRYGERRILATGLFLATGALVGALFVHGLVALGAMFALAGAAGASVFAASGRVVMGWFSAKERGLAMGLRQTSTPLGMGIAAVAIPPLAARHGVVGALSFTVAISGLVAVAIAAFIIDPPRPPKPAATAGAPRSPYHAPALWRVHGASVLLIWPQFTVGVFGLLFLVDVRHWDPTRAGQLLAIGQVVGALGRIAVGRWSDHVGSRLLPMRRLAALNGVLLTVLAVFAGWPFWGSDVILIVACGLTASTNGLSFTATAELAGPFWAGRALGVQNTGQNLTASLAPPLVGALIGATSYAVAFLVAAGFAAAAIWVTPADSSDPVRTAPPAPPREVAPGLDTVENRS